MKPNIELKFDIFGIMNISLVAILFFQLAEVARIENRSTNMSILEIYFLGVIFTVISSFISNAFGKQWIRYASWAVLLITVSSVYNPNIAQTQIITLMVFIIMSIAMTYVTKKLSYLITFFIIEALFLLYIYKDSTFIIIFITILYMLTLMKQQFEAKLRMVNKFNEMVKGEKKREQLHKMTIRYDNISISSIINEIIKKSNNKDTTYFSYKTLTLLKNTFIQRQYELKDIRFQLSMTDIAEEIKEGQKLLQIENFPIEYEINTSEIVLTDKENLRWVLMGLIIFVKDNNIEKIKINISQVAQFIKVKFIFPNKIVSYLQKDTISDTHKNSLWIDTVHIYQKLTGGEFNLEENELSISFLKV